jgi:hypothetical protein
MQTCNEVFFKFFYQKLVLSIFTGRFTGLACTITNGECENETPAGHSLLADLYPG